MKSKGKGKGKAKLAEFVADAESGRLPGITILVERDGDEFVDWPKEYA